MGLIYSNIPELEGTNTEISLSNLSQLEKDLANTFEKRLAHISELARAIASDGGDNDLIKSIFLSIRSDDDNVGDNVCTENAVQLSSIFSEISILERIEIFKQIFCQIPFEQNLFSGERAPITPNSEGRIAYLQNTYNDVAFGHFSTLLKNAKASYYESVSDICESVNNDICQFCILPIETEKDGKLLSFYNLIFKNGFKINAEFDLSNPDNGGYTRYALLAKELFLPTNQKVNKDKIFHLEILYKDTENISLKELLIAGDSFGANLCCADSIILNNKSQKKSLCVEFEITEINARAFMTYISIDYPEFVLFGFYKRK